jgi:hypothetical protein
LAGALFLLPGCGDDSSSPDTPETGTVVFQFDHVVDGAPLTLVDTYTNAAGNVYSVTLLEYIVSHFRFEAEGSGEDYVADVIHYRDHSDPGTRTLTLADVPAGDYSYLTFTFGIPASENVAGAFPELDILDMGWQMHAGGYHYMKHEGSYTNAGGGMSLFETHTGPSRQNDYSVEEELDLDAAFLRHGFEVVPGRTVTVRLTMNVNEWYEGPNTYDFNDYGPIMDDVGAQAILQENGADIWSAELIEE